SASDAKLNATARITIATFGRLTPRTGKLMEEMPLLIAFVAGESPRSRSLPNELEKVGERFDSHRSMPYSVPKLRSGPSGEPGLWNSLGLLGLGLDTPPVPPRPFPP